MTAIMDWWNKSGNSDLAISLLGQGGNAVLGGTDLDWLGQLGGLAGQFAQSNILNKNINNKLTPSNMPGTTEETKVITNEDGSTTTIKKKASESGLGSVNPQKDTQGMSFPQTQGMSFPQPQGMSAPQNIGELMSLYRSPREVDLRGLTPQQQAMVLNYAVAQDQQTGQNFRNFWSAKNESEMAQQYQKGGSLSNAARASLLKESRIARAVESLRPLKFAVKTPDGVQNVSLADIATLQPEMLKRVANEELSDEERLMSVLKIIGPAAMKNMLGKYSEDLGLLVSDIANVFGLDLEDTDVGQVIKRMEEEQKQTVSESVQPSKGFFNQIGDLLAPEEPSNLSTGIDFYDNSPQIKALRKKYGNTRADKAISDYMGMFPFGTE